MFAFLLPGGAGSGLLFSDLSVEARRVRVGLRLCQRRGVGTTVLPRLLVVDLDNAQPGSDFSDLAFFDEEFEDDAVEGGGDFDGCFVGLDLAEGVEGGDSGAWGEGPGGGG